MSNTDGAVLGATKIVDHGSDNSRWNLVIVSEGYRATETAQFHTDALNFANTLFATAPFDTLQGAINVHRLDVTSTDSGADDPTGCGGTGATPATFFDASFCTSGIRRLLVVDNASVIATVTANVPTWNMILVLVNSPIYGGSGGAVAVFSKAASANEIGLHEMGHTAFGLADEYEYWAGCGTGEAGHDNHPAVEPTEPNVTINSNRTTIKWASLVSAMTPMPTTSNANCADCDAQANPQPAGTVGAYEGAHYFHCDAFRPEFNCRMRMLGVPFCAVCRRQIVATLTPFLPPKTIFKEIKDAKHEKLEKFEAKEFKLEKIEKPELKEFKLEKVEKRELKEFKPEKIEVEGKRLDAEFPKLKDGEIDPWRDLDDIRNRVAQVETTLARLTHFITPEMRPDLSRGALRAEADVGATPVVAEPQSRVGKGSRRRRRSR
jgi:hypothetical protein